MATKKKKLKINPKKALILSLSIIAVCVVMLFVSISVATKSSTNVDNSKQTSKIAKTFSKKADTSEGSLEGSTLKNSTGSKGAVLEPEQNSSNKALSKSSTTQDITVKISTQNKAITPKEIATPKTQTIQKESSPKNTDTKSSNQNNKSTTKVATNKTTTQNITQNQVASGKIEQDEEVVAPKGSKGIVIIIFDDAGHSLDYLQPYLEIPFPVTISVLPKLAHSAESARRARLAGKEVMLHQPMQAKNLNISPGPGAILPTEDMDELKIKNIVLQNLAEIGTVKGINNHEGSLITENAWASGLVLDICRDKNVYFLDSRTTSQSAVPIAAKERGMKIYERDIFIDNTNSHADMLKEIEKGLKIAQRKGYVIMIGHIRPHGLAKLLTDNYKKWQNAGYEFSTISKAGNKIK